MPEDPFQHSRNVFITARKGGERTDVDAVWLRAYRIILIIGILMMTALGITNLVAPPSDRGAVLTFLPLLTALVLLLSLIRSLRNPSLRERDGPIISFVALAIYALGLFLNGEVSTPFLTAGIAFSYLITKAPTARVVSVSYLASTALLFVLSQDAPSPTALRTFAAAAGLMAAMDVVALAMTSLTERLRNETRSLQKEQRKLHGEVRESAEAVARSQEALTIAMASLLEHRSAELGDHNARVGDHMRVLAQAYRQRYHPEFDEGWVEDLALAAPLHDMGKVGVPDAILEKAGSLTPEEFEAMMKHTTVGRDIVDRVLLRVGMPVRFLTLARQLVYSHHERWDGTGYPEGLSGTKIPISARLMAVIDVYDAMVHERSYKEAMSHAEACSIIEAGSGSHFDPEVVDAFNACESFLARPVA